MIPTLRVCLISKGPLFIWMNCKKNFLKTQKRKKARVDFHDQIVGRNRITLLCHQLLFYTLVKKRELQNDSYFMDLASGRLLFYTLPQIQGYSYYGCASPRKVTIWIKREKIRNSRWKSRENAGIWMSSRPVTIYQSD